MLTLLLILLFTSKAQQLQDSKLNSVSKAALWSQTVLAQQDKKRVLKYWSSNKPEKDLDKRRDQFYQMSAQPLENPCHLLKRVGGVWFEQCGYLDGEKLICMDKLHKSVIKKDCLVYSFGMGRHWDFEIFMADLGCTVRAYDPAVKTEKLRENLHFFKGIIR